MIALLSHHHPEMVLLVIPVFVLFIVVTTWLASKVRS